MKLEQLSDNEIMHEMYIRCKSMNISDTMDLELNAESDEERGFIEAANNYILKNKQQEVIKQGKY